MTRDTSIFSPDLIVDVSGEEVAADMSHIYTGEIFGKLRHYIYTVESVTLFLKMCQCVKRCVKDSVFSLACHIL